jgi:hypothetical protein
VSEITAIDIAADLPERPITLAELSPIPKAGWRLDRMGPLPIGSMVIYFVRVGEFVKIGQTRNLALRVRSLQSSNPHPVEVLAVVYGTLDTELCLHDVFSEHHARGEWYHEKGTLAEFLKGAP